MESMALTQSAGVAARLISLQHRQESPSLGFIQSSAAHSYHSRVGIRCADPAKTVLYLACSLPIFPVNTGSCRLLWAIKDRHVAFDGVTKTRATQHV